MGTRGGRKPEHHLALLGAVGVGKSALTVKYLTRRYIMEYDPLLEDTYTKEESLDGVDVVVKIMDTYNKDDGRPENAARYLSWAHGFVVVYSITSRSTFDAAHGYLEAIGQYQRQHDTTAPPTILVANKMDLERYRTVSKVAGEELAARYECLFTECSAAEDLDSVEGMFHQVLREVQREQPLPEPLFISEPGFPRSPKPSSGSQPSKLLPKRGGMPSRPPATFRIFNKSFKIFN